MHYGRSECDSRSPNVYQYAKLRFPYLVLRRRVIVAHFEFIISTQELKNFVNTRLLLCSRLTRTLSSFIVSKELKSYLFYIFSRVLYRKHTIITILVLL